MSEWTKFVTAHFKKQQKKNPDYKFKDALKDAAKLYKKKGGADDDEGEDAAGTGSADAAGTGSADETVNENADGPEKKSEDEDEALDGTGSVTKYVVDDDDDEIDAESKEILKETYQMDSRLSELLTKQRQKPENYDYDNDEDTHEIALLIIFI